MNNFQREERYIVIKRKHLDEAQEDDIRNCIESHSIDSVECVVVESDWPEYETVWQMIEARVTGRVQGTTPTWDSIANITYANVERLPDGEAIPWHSPLGGLIEAQRVVRAAYRSVEEARAQNTHIPGNPYDVALAALNTPLAELDTLINAQPTPASHTAPADTKAEAEVLREALERIAAFGDPYEMSEEPEEFGGTDDGLETVCMAYENIQSIARAALNQGRQAS